MQSNSEVITCPSLPASASERTRMIRRLLAGLIFACLAIPGVSSAGPGEWIYTVRVGDNLWDITERFLSDMRYWRPLQALNRVDDPEHMPPGMRLRVPIAWLKLRPAAAKVLAVQGKAEATDARTGNRVALERGMQVRNGDEVRTGPEGNLTLQFGDGSLLLLQEDSRLVMESLGEYGDTGVFETRIRLPDGRVETKVTPRGPSAPRYEIWTPAAVSAVRGTRYRMSAGDSNGSTSHIEVVDGAVRISGSGKTQSVPAKFGVVARIGSPPSRPVPLLPPVDVSKLPSTYDRVPIRFEAPPLRGATAYRIQIARDRTFETLVFDETASSPSIAGRDLPDGDYVLRERGIDRRGLEGLDGIHSFTLNARPEPPFLVEPKANALIYEWPTTFQWSRPEHAADFHFQLADEPSFGAPLIDRNRHTQTRLAADRMLDPGTYYWRVATRDRSGEEGPFSDAQTFKLEPPQKVEASSVEDGAMVLRWSGSPGARYQFQLASDHGFEQVLVNQTVSGPQVRVPNPPSGFLYLRIRTLDAGGFVGDYGPVQRIDVPPKSYWPFAIFAVLVAVLAL